MNAVLNSIYTLVLGTFTLCSSEALAVDNVESFLFGQDSDYSRHLSERSSSALKFNWITEPELRITPERDVHGLNTETYKFRFRPSSSQERSLQSKLLGLEETLTALELEALLADSLSDRYLLVIEIARQEALFEIAQQELALDEQAIKLLEEQSNQVNFELGKLQQLLLTADLKREDIRGRRDAITRLRHITDIPAPALKPTRDAMGNLALTSYLATPTEIEAFLKTERLQTAQAAIAQRSAQAKLKSAKHKRSLEKRRLSFGLDLLELSYENKGIDSYNMTFGFRLPTKSYGSYRSHVEYVAAQRTADLTDKIAAQQTKQATQEIFAEIDTYFALTRSLLSTSKNSPSELEHRHTSVDPDSAMVIRQHRLKLSALIINQHAAALGSLTDALRITGLIYQQPLTNWLASP